MTKLEAIELKAHVPARDFEVSTRGYVHTWWAQFQAKQIAEKYGVEIGVSEDRVWKMRDFTLVGPAGVCWRIAQNIE